MRPPNRPAARPALLRLVGAGLALALLSGCADKDVQSFFQPLKQGLAGLDETLRSNTVPPASIADSEAPHPTMAGPAKPVVAPVPVAETTRQPAAAAQQTASRAQPAAPALRAASELVGLESTMVEQRLGTPALRRRDEPAELWQYRSPLCVMDVFLYSDGRSFKVMHVELHPRSPEQIAAPACLASFGEQHKPAPTAG